MTRFFPALAGLALTAASTQAFAAATENDRVRAYDTESYSWVAEESGQTFVSLDGATDGEVDLDLRIYDARGHLIASGLSLDDLEQVEFSARAGATYTLQVKNLGDIASGFSLEVTQPEHVLRGRARSHNSKSYTYTTRRTGRATVTLHGDGDTDLDIVIRDSRGRVVAEADSYDDHELLTFRYRANETYSIEVVNLGHVYNDFVLTIED